ncbi:transaminase [Phytohabitans rumicis]|uniref:Aminotransferase n=2 Tax=Phytohabitans rumicis TaxID=1076125 RepID=A0A6V8LLY5_9ACTN|nr:transaminase [Phytohabitans rumicis]GFJ95107.1 aminotransferase [Phytohabitans rumicis]
MLPTEEAAEVGAELARRFGVPQWSFALTATDANRWAIRLLRAVTGRPRILVNSYCYHGSVDESLIVVGPDGRARSRDGNVGAPYDVTQTSRVAEYNDLDGLARELAHGDVAAVLMEPALTNIGIVLPEPGYLAGVRALTREHGTYLINDETHTFSAGPGGATAAWSLEPDVVTIGKAIGGGIPIGAYGLSAALSALLSERSDLDLVDMGGVGGTLAGNPLSLTAAHATLRQVLTDAAFAGMIEVATAFAAGVRKTIDEYALPWSVNQLGARVEYRFVSPAPRTGGESAAHADADLEDYLHVYLANRGVLLTPFHNMALACPQTTADDVARHHEVFAAAVAELMGGPTTA